MLIFIETITALTNVAIRARVQDSCVAFCQLISPWPQPHLLSDFVWFILWKIGFTPAWSLTAQSFGPPVWSMRVHYSLHISFYYREVGLARRRNTQLPRIDCRPRDSEWEEKKVLYDTISSRWVVAHVASILSVSLWANRLPTSGQISNSQDDECARVRALEGWYKVN